MPGSVRRGERALVSRAASATDPSAPSSLDGRLTEWKADRAGLHDSTVLRQQLDQRASGAAVDRGREIQATGFIYVGEQTSGGP
jgi:hypothetical protein